MKNYYFKMKIIIIIKAVPKTRAIKDRTSVFVHTRYAQLVLSDFEFLQGTETERFFSFLKRTMGNYKSEKKTMEQKL